MSQKKIYNNNILQRLIRNYILTHKLNISFALIMMIISASTTGLHAWLVRPALDDVLIRGDRQMLLLIPLAIIITTVFKGCATYLHFVAMHKVTHRIISTLQSEMFSKLMFFNLKFYSESKTGNLISRLINDTNFLRLAIIKSITSSKEIKEILHDLDVGGQIKNMAVMNVILCLEELSDLIHSDFPLYDRESDEFPSKEPRKSRKENIPRVEKLFTN